MVVPYLRGELSADARASVEAHLHECGQCRELAETSASTLAALTFLDSWNDFLWPLIAVNSTDKMTLQLGLATFQGAHATQWSLLMAGNVICVAGLFVTLWARWTLAGNWSSDVTFKEGHELIETGPYRFVRHPIYTGLLIMCVGTAIEIGMLRGILGLALMTLGFWIKLKQEERLLMRHFPEEYPAYSKRVKALVPYVL